MIFFQSNNPHIWPAVLQMYWKTGFSWYTNIDTVSLFCRQMLNCHDIMWKRTIGPDSSSSIENLLVWPPTPTHRSKISNFLFILYFKNFGLFKNCPPHLKFLITFHWVGWLWIFSSTTHYFCLLRQAYYHSSSITVIHLCWPVWNISLCCCWQP